MKKAVSLLLLVLIIVSIAIFFIIKNKVRSDFHQKVQLPIITQTPTIVETAAPNSSLTTSLFVPYWSIDQNSKLPQFGSYIYFGIVPSATGIDMEENGAQDIPKFLSSVPSTGQKLLALRMIDSTQDNTILKSPALENAIIQDTLTLAKTNGFTGVVLDLEISGIPIGPLEGQINTFSQLFYKQAQVQDLSFYQLIYGDTFFRLRPFDVKTLAQNTDGIMVMAYDFSKANGNPGPNFPLNGKGTFGYDMTSMANDFLQFVPNNKITVVFGLFGYDWPVDNQGNAISQGQPLTDQQIQTEFLHGCSFSPCTITHDMVSSETTIHYTDKNKQKHIVWFEDMNSIAQKEKYLQGRGISNYALWAYSYF